MKLKSVTIGGFKNIRKTKINLSNITAIISPNNYGKSNLLEAIDFGVEFISASEKDRKNIWTGFWNVATIGRDICDLYGCQLSSASGLYGIGSTGPNGR